MAAAASYPAAMILILAAFGASADGVSSRNQDMASAIQEMRKASHYTFVMLINMSPVDLFERNNITFLMPSDKTLSGKSITNATDFLLRHAIPSPMLFNHLSYVPTDSLIPSLHPDYALRVSNRGRLSFFLNNVRLTSPNLCVAGMSIRCHGIDDVLSSASGGSWVSSCPGLPSPPISPNPAPAGSNVTASAVGPEPAPGPANHSQISKSWTEVGHRTAANSMLFLAMAALFVLC